MSDLRRTSLARNSPLTRARMRVADWRQRGVYAGYPDRYRCVFIHIPKAAGSGIAQALFGQGSRHVPYFEFEQANPDKFRRYFKFAFVRNPWDRLVSSYFYLKAGGSGEQDRQWAERHLQEFPDFATFVNGWLTEDNIWSGIHFVPQHYFLCDADLRVKMDFVGRVENIAADFRTVCERLNIEAALPHANRSEHRHYSEYYTHALQEHVASVYAADIATFGYRFEA